MNALFKLFVIAAAFACAASPALAAALKIGASDGIQTVLTAQKGSRVTVRTRSGQDVTGLLREVNANVVQLGAVDAVYVRVKE